MIAATRTALLVCAVCLILPATAAGQVAADCAALLKKRAPAVPQTSDPCYDLAIYIYAMAPKVTAAAATILKPDAVPVGAVFSQRDLQARHPQQPSLAGTAAQGQAIPTVQPAGVAAGTIAAVGTNAGQDAIAALSLNPAILFLGEEVTRQLAQYSRFLDLTMFVPVSATTDTTTTVSDRTRLRYFGARVRLNIHGIAAGSTVWDRARALIANWISQGERNVRRVHTALATAPGMVACANALLDNAADAVIAGACGGAVRFEINLAEAEELRSQFAVVRRAADSRYFGADIRYDHGDPTLGAVANAAGDFLFAGLAFGRRLTGSAGTGAMYGFRSRLGVRHAKLDSATASEFAAEGGFGFDLSRVLEAQEINASAALEFRYGNAPAPETAQFQTNFVMFRGSFVLPITAGNSVSLNFAAPMSGDVSPTLSVNFNWGVLLPDGRGVR